MTKGIARFGLWLEDHALPLLSALATTGGILGSVLVSRSQWWWLLLGPSCTLIVWVLIRGVKHEDRLSVLRTEISTLRNDLVTARKPTIVALLTSAMSEEWQTLLEQDLVSILLERNYHPVVYAAKQNYSIPEQEHNLIRMLMDRERLLGAIVVPVAPESREEELRQFCSDFCKPVVFVDNAPFSSGTPYPANSAFVGVDSRHGGRLAAEAALESFRQEPAKHILVIASNTQVDRQNEFRETILKAWPSCKVDVDESGGFDQKKASVSARLRLRAACKAGDPVDAVFCTSDSMMLGCLAAINELTGVKGFRTPRLFSYDGTLAIRELAETTKSRLCRVVIQDPSAVAVATVNRLERLLRGEQASGPHWIEPTLFPSVESHL